MSVKLSFLYSSASFKKYANFLKNSHFSSYHPYLWLPRALHNLCLTERPKKMSVVPPRHPPGFVVPTPPSEFPMLHLHLQEAYQSCEVGAHHFSSLSSTERCLVLSVTGSESPLSAAIIHPRLVCQSLAALMPLLWRPWPSADSYLARHPPGCSRCIWGFLCLGCCFPAGTAHSYALLIPAD